VGRATVLLVDDDDEVCQLVATTLEIAGYDVQLANDAAAAFVVLDRMTPDLILLDVMLPDLDGCELCRRIRRRTSCAHVPIVMLTARAATDDAVAGFDAGADDYIAKPFSPRELIARVDAKVRRSAAESSLNPLTRLPANRAIENELRRRFEEHRAWAVVYLDLDNFKAFNDVYGFVRGDEAIRLLAAILLEMTQHYGGSDGFVGHIGGDDFIVVGDPTGAHELAARALEDFDRKVRALYDPADLARGWIETHDRRGSIVRFPLMSISAALVTDTSPVESYAQVGAIAAELKAFAKLQPGSFVAVDQRHA
jgi:diguanylate cyclase (GGDEF)-like protein